MVCEGRCQKRNGRARVFFTTAILAVVLFLNAVSVRAESAAAISRDLGLTEAEHAWLARNHTVRVRAADFPPFIFSGANHTVTGISVEYLNLIADRTGINSSTIYRTSRLPKPCKD